MLTQPREFALIPPAGRRRPTVAARRALRMAEVQAGRGHEGAAPVPANAQQSALLSLLHTMLLVATSPGYGNASDTATTHWFTFISMVWGDPSPLYSLVIL